MPWTAHLCLSSCRSWTLGNCGLLAFGASEHRVPNPTKRPCDDLSQFAGSHSLEPTQHRRSVPNTVNRHPDTWSQAAMATMTPAQCAVNTAVMLSFCAAVLHFRSDGALRQRQSDRAQRKSTHEGNRGSEPINTAFPHVVGRTKRSAGTLAINSYQNRCRSRAAWCCAATSSQPHSSSDQTPRVLPGPR